MEKYKRLFSIYNIYYISKIEILKCGAKQYSFKTKDFELKHIITHHDKVNAKISGLSLISFFNLNAFQVYYRQKKKQEATEIINSLNLRSKNIIQKYYR
ncbi:hypothetical protein tooticki91_gp014 [Flavobacterium phage vB_FspS_tooticki9-1]|uniref:Uncharacterized protein n=31 Tax=Caudoviricetes TaxID=2731619 RepID=A0A6B9LG86_9CAUD|nr:hypothetical protein HWC87_gp20 [Flavobacterium phage vB_FspS_filifjonk9-1]YP_009854664.1 hypothetical protein HWC88_gp12 [Flavobacterium phage vB_FspS_hattifnatt9-1]YP_009854745.1 hypothetical protein HWC89_gp17 [Flavobacterium phage vB_FspS_hemulen6-1]YP_009854873.1 hypothetical protein HWC91_gp18 [Flavobacterium phage vB_FspS_lillamy9-1]YP_009854948.1 hypothetical protein HWC92_gp20 [Flavobacterium phage vB_FspS_morran9-1]YP_009855017.1 hypothetical protein HWC93_gp16 [Flavobacterium pha